MKRILGFGLAFAVSSVVLASSATAQSPSEAELRAIASCREIPKSKDRLKCFERTTEILEQFAPFAAAQAANESDEEESVVDRPATVAATPASQYGDDDDGADPIASFGAEDLVVEDEKQIKELRTVALSITQNKRGKYIIELDNGQVWRQLPGDTNRLHVRKDKEGDGHDVIIKKRSLGAYALRLTTAKRSILVRRIK